MVFFLSRRLAAACCLAAAAGCSEKAASLLDSPPAQAEQRPAAAPSGAVAPLPATDRAALPAASASAPAPSAAPPPARIYSKARFAWINPGPYRTQNWIGYLGIGGSVALRGGTAEAARTHARGCKTWYAVEPRGYVCPGDSATLDANDPVVVALRQEAPRADSPWPYEYAESLGATRYPRLPTLSDQRDEEADLERHLANVEKARAVAVAGAGDEAIRRIDPSLVGVDLTPAGVGPGELFPFNGLVRDERKEIIAGSTVAFTHAFDAGGRTWVVTSDQAYMPKDRLKPYPRSQFQGVWLKDGRSLPLAFFRKEPRPKFRKREDGRFEPTGERFERLAWVGLTDRSEVAGGQRYLETSEPGIYVRAGDAVVVKRREPSPIGARPPGSPPRKWFDVSVLRGWLVAYEEKTPVFTTLISPGRGLLPKDGIPEIETASTPRGHFRIDGKFITATMVSSTNENIVHSEVQFVQNFHGPHAFHAAYWHDDWGEPKSGGCINLSPIDAKQMFEWADPPLPPGWHGLRAVPDGTLSTAVFIHR